MSVPYRTETYSNPHRLKARTATCLAIFIILAVVFYLVSAYGAEITPLMVARAEIGRGEWLGNNRGPDIRKYLNGREGLPWCAGFISYCARKAGLNIPYTFKAKDFINLGQCLAPIEVQKGDLVIFTRKGGGHIGIVEKVFRRDLLHPVEFISIEGNVGDYPAKVKRIKHNFHESNIYRFVRMG